MKIKSIIIMLLPLFGFTACHSQVKHAKTVVKKVSGNCDMCKKTIEEAGTSSKQYQTVWDVDKKLARITYDSTSVSPDQVLKKIALSGYDNEMYLAPDQAYNALPECCQYKRNKPGAVVVKEENVQDTTVKKAESLKVDHVAELIDAYIVLKDALVKTDSKSAATAAFQLLIKIDAVKTDEISEKAAAVWLNVVTEMKVKTKAISDSKTIDIQRSHFDELSVSFHDFVVELHTGITLYYQHCPMANDGQGANWISKENTVKNPYYGNVMLNCGKTIETIK